MRLMLMPSSMRKESCSLGRGHNRILKMRVLRTQINTIVFSLGAGEIQRTRSMQTLLKTTIRSRSNLMKLRRKDEHTTLMINQGNMNLFRSVTQQI